MSGTEAPGRQDTLSARSVLRASTPLLCHGAVLSVWPRVAMKVLFRHALAPIEILCQSGQPPLTVIVARYRSCIELAAARIAIAVTRDTGRAKCQTQDC